MDMIAEIDEFLVYDEMFWVMGQTGRRQVDCSRRAIADSDKSRRADVEKTGGRRAQPASTSRRQISDVTKVDNDRFAFTITKQQKTSLLLCVAFILI